MKDRLQMKTWSKNYPTGWRPVSDSANPNSALKKIICFQECW